MIYININIDINKYYFTNIIIYLSWNRDNVEADVL